MSEMLEGAKGSVSSVLSGMMSLDILTDEQQQALQKAVGAMEIFCGASQMITVATALQEVRNVKASAEAVALTAANSWNPVGLAKVALASALAVGVGVGMYAILDTVLEGNLNDPVDRARVETQAGY